MSQDMRKAFKNRKALQNETVFSKDLFSLPPTLPLQNHVAGKGNKVAFKKPL
jgi:hypothetical protein